MPATPAQPTARPPARPTPTAAATPTPAQAAALAWLHGARFATTASALNQLPQGDVPELAFVGRSNAGKSSAINALAQRRQLAFASKTPGRTQHINLFTLGAEEAPEAYLADLPGYGYASVERAAKLRWQQVMADYLAQRRNLAGVVQLVDSRVGLTALDEQLLAFLTPRVATGEVKLLVVLTKTDKLNRREQQAAEQRAVQALGELTTEAADVGVLSFSAPKRTGLGDLAEALHQWVRAVPRLAQVDIAALPPAPPDAGPDAA